MVSREVKIKQEISRINAEMERKATDFTNTQTQLNMGINLENIQATRRAEARDAELSKEVEVKRGETKLERMRAEHTLNQFSPIHTQS